MLERLQKILSRYSLASRREAEKIILSGRVIVNGKIVKELGTKADSEIDQILVDGKLLDIKSPQPIYLLLNKPTGIVCTCADPQNRKTVIDILPHKYQHLYPVGRLDYNSSGALILTNDGNFANHMMHPRHHVPKTYHVWVKDIPKPKTLEHWREGVLLDERVTIPADVDILQIDRTQNQFPKTLLKIILSEGRNRQIRRVADQLGHPVLKLHRVAIASISIDGINAGEFRMLSDREIKSLSN
ncbi:MAG: pseudouridine synthase [Pseudanabaena sp.]|nr:MAG: pseudouridine synthase [Pseudanabaena sp.]